jgi:hypothetical protein
VDDDSNRSICDGRTRRVAGRRPLETTDSTATVVNLYDWGTVSGLPYFDAASSFAAAAKGGPEAAEAFTSIRIRLSRAARAFDHLLAALSNPLDGKRVKKMLRRLPLRRSTVNCFILQQRSTSMGVPITR